MIVEEETYLIKTKEECDSYYQLVYLSIDDQLKKSEVKIENKDLLITFYHDITKDLKEVEKAGKYLEMCMIRPKFNIKLYTLLDKIFNDPEYKNFIEDNEWYLKLVDQIHLYLVTINNMLGALTYYIVNHNLDLDDNTTKNIFALWRFIIQTYANTKLYTEEEMKRFEYAGKGIRYCGKYNINIEFLFAYTISQMENIGILEEIKHYFEDSFGSNYYILEMIKKDTNES